MVFVVEVLLFSHLKKKLCQCGICFIWKRFRKKLWDNFWILKFVNIFGKKKTPPKTFSFLLQICTARKNEAICLSVFLKRAKGRGRMFCSDPASKLFGVGEKMIDLLWKLIWRFPSPISLQKILSDVRKKFKKWTEIWILLDDHKQDPKISDA